MPTPLSPPTTPTGMEVRERRVTWKLAKIEGKGIKTKFKGRVERSLFGFRQPAQYSVQTKDLVL